jgi:hypothetical protein
VWPQLLASLTHQGLVRYLLAHLVALQVGLLHLVSIRYDAKFGRNNSPASLYEISLFSPAMNCLRKSRPRLALSIPDREPREERPGW